MEYVSPEGLRLDGRRPTEMRQLRAEVGVVAKADGSASFEMGNTKVIAAVYGPRESPIQVISPRESELFKYLLHHHHGPREGSHSATIWKVENQLAPL